MDTLAKETMGLPIFICAMNNQIIASSGKNKNKNININRTSQASTSGLANYDSNSTSTSPTTPNFLTTTTSFFTSTTSTPTTKEPTTNTNTYTPPIPDSNSKSLSSTNRLSQAFDFATTVVESAWRRAEWILSDEETALSNEDLESVDLERGEGKGNECRYRRFGDGDGFGDWLD